MKVKKYLSGQFSYKIDIGRVRLTNDDRTLAVSNARGNVLLVACDGIGGAKKGDFAAELAVKTLQEKFLARKRNFLNRTTAFYWLSNSIKVANKKIYNESLKNDAYHGMGTTLTAVLLINDFYVIAQIGDSRCYTISQRDNRIKQLTEDQTYVAYLFRTGTITEEQMESHPKRHVLMNALGTQPSTEIDMRIRPYLGEPMLLCTDGLYNNVPKQDIENVMLSDDSVEQKINQLISMANGNGGSDNIGIVLWEANN